MTDFAKCSGLGCQVREDCLRFTAEFFPHERWFSFYAQASFKAESGCDYILPVLPDDPSNGPRPPGALREAA